MGLFSCVKFSASQTCFIYIKNIINVISEGKGCRNCEAFSEEHKCSFKKPHLRGKKGSVVTKWCFC